MPSLSVGDKPRWPLRFLQWRRVNAGWIEPWYVVYALLGFLVAGLIPVLLPLLVNPGGNAAVAGIVVAAVSLGGLTAPIWGGWADRSRSHRSPLVAGLVLAAAALAFFPFTTHPAVWCVLAILFGAGAAGAATVANLFIVEAHPRSEWDGRIGWLQTFYGVGQVAGLLAAALLSRGDLRLGMLVAAAVCALAALAGWMTTGNTTQTGSAGAVLIYPARHAEGSILSPQRLFHMLNRGSFAKLGPALRSPFGAFLLTWLLAVGGSAAVFSQYPVLMQQVYGIAPAASSAGFAVAAGLGLLLYTPAGRWSEHFGSGRVYRIGLALRFAAFAGMIVLDIFGAGRFGWLALPAFALVVLAWSLLSVSGTAIAAGLSPEAEGEGMGIFNAATALASVIGAVLGGWIAGLWGFGSLSAVAAVGVGFGLILTFAGNPIRNPGLDVGR